MRENMRVDIPPNYVRSLSALIGHNGPDQLHLGLTPHNFLPVASGASFKLRPRLSVPSWAMLYVCLCLAMSISVLHHRPCWSDPDLTWLPSFSSAPSCHCRPAWWWWGWAWPADWFSAFTSHLPCLCKLYLNLDF